MLPTLRILARIRNFHVFPKDNDARPIVVASNFVGLYADQRILPHPFDLLPQRGKAAQSLGLIGKINGNDIGPVVAGASKSAVAQPSQHIATFPGAHLRDEHWLLDCLHGFHGMNAFRFASSRCVLSRSYPREGKNLPEQVNS